MSWGISWTIVGWLAVFSIMTCSIIAFSVWLFMKIEERKGSD